MKIGISMEGVVSYIMQGENGDIQLVMDDVSSADKYGSSGWKHEALFTYNNYDAASFESLNLSKEQYAEIGQNIVLRLLAMNKRNIL